jgi:Fur family ferric uptake transcriptional regulator
MVLEALLAADGPVSADHLARTVGGKGTPLDTASVHRNLAQLEELGLVRHVHIGHGPGLYAIVGAAEREYIACERCGRVTSVEPAKLDSVRRTIRRKFGYEARFSHFPILGLCRSCAEAPDGQAEAKGALEIGDHEHEHSHGDYVHSHPHVHEKGLEGDHEHGHDQRG